MRTSLSNLRELPLPEEVSTFSDLVREAFIDPLRSVLIVDDEYPTWEEVLNSAREASVQEFQLQEHSTKKSWRKTPQELIDVVNGLRGKKPGFVIDIHDPMAPKMTGEVSTEETPDQLADHLHQSDLLILDYNLEGKGSGLRGKKAREILRSVLTNQHFNLVILHTGESSLDEVMGECLISLLGSCTAEFEQKMRQEIDDLDLKLTVMEDSEKFHRGSLNENFTMDDYLEARQCGKSVVQAYMSAKGRLARLCTWGKALNLAGGELRTFLFWAIREFEKTKLNEFSDQPPDDLKWKNDNNFKWLRTSKGFVTFVEKGPSDLLGNLQSALVNWKPTPSRLLSAKYRHVLNRSGVKVEDSSLSKKHVFAMFYKNIRETARERLSQAQTRLSQTYKLKDHVVRQSEAISFLIEDEIVEFGERIIAADLAAGNTFATHYGVDLTNAQETRLAVNQFNNYVSTLPSKSTFQGKEVEEQLDSGHIFKLDDEWWVCATPACDLQPGQNTIAFKGQSDNLRPFTALRLDKIDTDKLQKEHINGGSYCFVEESGKIVGLGPLSLTDDSKPASQKVRWRTFVAKRGGLIVGGKLEIIQLELGAEDLNFAKSCATVLAKLRYEYALNYIQKIGTSVSRIGLGYEVYPSGPPPTSNGG